MDQGSPFDLLALSPPNVGAGLNVFAYFYFNILHNTLY